MNTTTTGAEARFSETVTRNLRPRRRGINGNFIRTVLMTKMIDYTHNQNTIFGGRESLGERIGSGKGMYNDEENERDD